MSIDIDDGVNERALDDFGETFLAPGGREFKALWDSAPDIVLDVQTNSPVIWTLHAEIERLPRGTVITRLREKARYTVENHAPDGRLEGVVITLSKKD